MNPVLKMHQISKKKNKNSCLISRIITLIKNCPNKNSVFKANQKNSIGCEKQDVLRNVIIKLFFSGIG